MSKSVWIHINFGNACSTLELWVEKIGGSEIFLILIPYLGPLVHSVIIQTQTQRLLSEIHDSFARPFIQNQLYETSRQIIMMCFVRWNLVVNRKDYGWIVFPISSRRHPVTDNSSLTQRRVPRNNRGTSTTHDDSVILHRGGEIKCPASVEIIVTMAMTLNYWVGARHRYRHVAVSILLFYGTFITFTKW